VVENRLRQRFNGSNTRKAMKDKKTKFWDGVRESAKRIQNGPSWLKAGITLNPEVYETYRPMEAPCEETKGPCEWSSEEEYDENGDMVSWDSYCGNCYRNRDWSKDEYKNLTANDR